MESLLLLKPVTKAWRSQVSDGKGLWLGSAEGRKGLSCPTSQKQSQRSAHSLAQQMHHKRNKWVSPMARSWLTVLQACCTNTRRWTWPTEKPEVGWHHWEDRQSRQALWPASLTDTASSRFTPMHHAYPTHAHACARTVSSLLFTILLIKLLNGMTSRTIFKIKDKLHFLNIASE